MKNILLIFALFAFVSTSEATTVRGTILKDIKQNHVSIYINSIYDEAIAVCSKYGLPPALLIAQCCQESSFGRSNVAKCKNNHLGIKKNKKEYMQFKTIEDCFEKWAQIMTEKTCYCEKPPSNLPAWANRLESCNYAHKGYSKHIKKLILKYKLNLI